MKHQISQREAKAIRNARAPRSIEGMSSIELADEAARGNRAAAEKLQWMRDMDAAESRARCQ